MAMLDNSSSDFFCPVKKCFEFACEASAKAKAAPEYKKEYQEIEHRWRTYDPQFFSFPLHTSKLTVLVVSRVARFFLTQYAKTRENLPYYYNITKWP
jgi:hypothetical protein